MKVSKKAYFFDLRYSNKLLFIGKICCFQNETLLLFASKKVLIGTSSPIELVCRRPF
jgi:hypothetical protein